MLTRAGPPGSVMKALVATWWQRTVPWMLALPHYKLKKKVGGSQLIVPEPHSESIHFMQRESGLLRLSV